MSYFEEIASRYHRDSTTQRSAAERLLALAAVGPREDVLDVGCGTGALLARLRTLTAGRVTGAEPSAAMVEEARRGAPPGVEVVRCAAEDLAYEGAFDLVLSNSALHWFTDVPRALSSFRRALRPGGRTAIQAPATERYCPPFVDAMEEVARDPRTREVYAARRSPWRWLPAACDYAALVAAAGFEVREARFEDLVTRETPEGALRIFRSAAEAGYLAPGCYPFPLPAGYRDDALGIVRGAFERRAGPDGRLDVPIRRVFLAARAA